MTTINTKEELALLLHWLFDSLQNTPDFQELQKYSLQYLLKNIDFNTLDLWSHFKLYCATNLPTLGTQQIFVLCDVTTLAKFLSNKTISLVSIENQVAALLRHTVFTNLPLSQLLLTGYSFSEATKMLKVVN